MRLLKIAATSVLAVATAAVIATPAYAGKSFDDVTSKTGELYVTSAPDEVSDPADETGILKKAPDIDQENAEFVAEQRSAITRGDDIGLVREDSSSSLTTKDQSALDRVSSSRDNLIGNVVKTTIDERKGS